MEKPQRHELPKNWRQQVAQTLNSKGFSVNEQKVYNTVRGVVKDEHIVAAVAIAVKRLRTKHAKKVNRLAALRAA